MNKTNFKEKIFYISILIVVILAIFKYTQYPEPYTFGTNCTEDRVKINGNLIKQTIILNDKSRWNGDAYYSIYFSIDTQPTSGYIELSLMQKDRNLSNIKINASDIKEGFYDIRTIDYSKLLIGKGYDAIIEIRESNLDQNVFLGLSDSSYNLPGCEINGAKTDNILAQKYHFHFMNNEYIVRLVLFSIFIVINIISAFFLFNFNETKQICRLLQIGVIISYISASFIYNSEFFIAPLHNELTTNYVHNAITYNVFRNIVATDAGYLPLCQRLITLFVFKVLKLRAYYAVYVMQFIAYVLSGYFLSFFMKIQFREYLPLKWRYLICLLCSLYLSGGQQIFYNSVYLGIILILCMLLIDMKKWSRQEFIVLCLFSALICMSKGTYVTLIPLMVVYVMLFYKRIKKREIIYVCFCFIASFIQLLYYFLYGTNTAYGIAGNWTSKVIEWGGMHGKYAFMIIMKLIYSVILDTPNNMLIFFGGSVSLFNGIGFLLITGFWLIVFGMFYKEIILNWIRKREINIDYARLFLLLAFIVIFALLLRISVYGISDIKKDTLFTFKYQGIQKYNISIIVAVICFYFCCVDILSKKYGVADKLS